MSVRRKLVKTLDYLFVDHVGPTSIGIISGFICYYLSPILFFVGLGLATVLVAARRPIARFLNRKADSMFESLKDTVIIAAREKYGVPSCSKCGKDLPNRIYYAVVEERELPYCENCVEALGDRVKKITWFDPPM